MTMFNVNHPINKSFDGLINELFNEIPANFGKTMREDVLKFPPVNITEKKDHYHLELSAPGLSKADFSVKLENNLLTISSEKKAIKNDETDKLIRREFSYKAFKRSFSVDENIDATGITAKYENGILELNLPKKEKEKNNSKEITIL